MKAIKHWYRFPQKDCINPGFGDIQNSIGLNSVKPDMTLKLALFWKYNRQDEVQDYYKPKF